MCVALSLRSSALSGLFFSVVDIKTYYQIPVLKTALAVAVVN